jgi:lipopolysaccharide/colanic/teichoic acid biosynthesis glycosyltransferase
VARREDQRQRRYFACKRALDIVLTLMILLLLWPLMVLIAVLIKLDSSGPVFFVQERVGARRRWRADDMGWDVCAFPCYKFRSMFYGADQSLHKAYTEAFVEGRAAKMGEDAAGGLFKLVNDPRVTRVGRILRKSSMDELPQLLNVLKGEMSLVGPRPVPTYEVAQYNPQQWERVTVWPGLTGLWQVYGRCQVTFDDMVRMDLEYIRRQSLWLDVKILTLTLPAIFSGKGAD